MQMTSSSAAYLLPGPSSSISGKSTLIKSAFPTPVPLATSFHSIHPISHPPLQTSFYRSPVSSHANSPIVRSSAGTPAADSSHSLTVNNLNSNSSIFNNHPSSASNGTDETSVGSSGHSLSHSMESINNIGLTDDEVRKKVDENHAYLHQIQNTLQSLTFVTIRRPPPGLV